MHDIILKNNVGLLIALNLVAAFSLLLFPRTLRRVNDFLNKWISTRKLLMPLERVRNIDDKIYEKRKAIGVLFLVFAPVSKNISVSLIPISAILAVFFILFPKTLKRVNDFLNKWISTRKLLKPLEIVRNIDDKIYRSRKVLGALSLITILFLIRCYIML